MRTGRQGEATDHMNGNTDYDCIIVGAGPTGATLAALLGRCGQRVLLLERDALVYALPRAVHMDHEILRIIQQLGLADALAPHAQPLDTYRFENANGEPLMESRGGGRLALSGYVASSMFVQPELERLLREALMALPSVSLRLGANVDALAADDAGVTVTWTQHAPTDSKQASTVDSARARYVIGCDGASSFVRRSLGIEMEDLGFDEPWVVVDMKIVGDIGLAPDVAYQFCDPRRPTTCVPGGPGRRRWEFMLLPGETRDSMGTWDAIWPLLEPWGGRATLEPIRLAVYRFHALIARRWRDGRVLLAGDAAHQTPPFMGQGLCSGLRDAANVAWKLDLVLRGQAGDALLDSYEIERGPHVRHVVQTSVAMGRIVCELDPAKAAARDAFMQAALAAGSGPIGGGGGGQVAPLTAGALRAGDDGAGLLFPQPFVVRDGAPVRLDDLVGDRVLLAVQDASLLPDAAAFAAHGIMPMVFGDGRRAVVEADGPSATRWLAERNLCAALVRRDRTVFGTVAVTPMASEEVLRLVGDYARTIGG